jgi:hypothetical protein
MNSHPHAAPELALATDTSAATPTTISCPIAAAVKARAKVLKKWRKHERMRLFIGWCAGCHALGFSF